MEIAETRQSSTVLFQNSKIIKPSWAYPRDLRPAQQHELTTQSGPSKRHPLTKLQKAQALLDPPVCHHHPRLHVTDTPVSTTPARLRCLAAPSPSSTPLHSTPRHRWIRSIATGGAMPADGSKKKGVPPLGWWLMLVGSLRLASVWFGFFDIWALRVAVFSQAESECPRPSASLHLQLRRLPPCVLAFGSPTGSVCL